MLKKSWRPYVFEFLGSTLPQMVGIGVSAVMVRHAGADVYGQYSMLLAIVTLAWGIFCTAVDQSFQRSCDPEKVFAALSDKVIGWVFVLPVLVGGVLWSSIDAPTLIFFAVGMLFWQAVQSRVVRDRIRGRDIWSLLPRVVPVLVFLGLLLTYRPSDIRNVSLLFMIAWLTGLAYSFKLCIGIRLDFRHWWTTVRCVWPIWLSALIAQSYGSVDLYILGMLRGVEAVGIYKIAYTFASMVIPAFTSFCYVYLTKISLAIHSRDLQRVRKTFRTQMLLCSAFAVGLLVFMGVGYPYAAVMLYGDTGRETIFPAQILALAMVFNTFTMVYSFSLLSLHKERYNVVLGISRAVFYLTSSLFLIRAYGAVGAGIAMTLAYGLFLGGYHFVYRRALKTAFTRGTPESL